MLTIQQQRLLIVKSLNAGGMNLKQHNYNNYNETIHNEMTIFPQGCSCPRLGH